jgi:hypothetical protein
VDAAAKTSTAAGRRQQLWDAEPDLAGRDGARLLRGDQAGQFPGLDDALEADLAALLERLFVAYRAEHETH